MRAAELQHICAIQGGPCQGLPCFTGFTNARCEPGTQMPSAERANRYERSHAQIDEMTGRIAKQDRAGGPPKYWEAAVAVQKTQDI